MDLKPRTCYTASGKHKMTFTSRSIAKQHARKHHTVYKCGTCGFWHMASK